MLDNAVAFHAEKVVDNHPRSALEVGFDLCQCCALSKDYFAHLASAVLSAHRMLEQFRQLTTKLVPL